MISTLDVDRYLSEAHGADRANGCAVAALGADIARQNHGVRRGLVKHVQGQLDRLTRLLKNGPAAGRRKRAIAALAGMVGAVTLARAVDDPALSKEILAVARNAFGYCGSNGGWSPRHIDTVIPAPERDQHIEPSAPGQRPAAQTLPTARHGGVIVPSVLGQAASTSTLAGDQ